MIPLGRATGNTSPRFYEQMCNHLDLVVFVWKPTFEGLHLQIFVLLRVYDAVSENIRFVALISPSALKSVVIYRTVE